MVGAEFTNLEKQKRKKKKEKTMCLSLTLHFGAGRLLSWIRIGARPDALQATVFLTAVLFRWMGAEFSSEGGRHTLAGVLLGDIPLPHHPWSLQLLFVLAASSSTPS